MKLKKEGYSNEYPSFFITNITLLSKVIMMIHKKRRPFSGPPHVDFDLQLLTNPLSVQLTLESSFFAD